MDFLQEQQDFFVFIVCILVASLITTRNAAIQHHQKHAEDDEQPPRQRRRMRRHERPNDQFAVMMAASDERFRQEYRMSRATFMEVFRRIEPRLQRVNLFGDVVEPMKRLAICLARLVRGSYYHEIGELYGVGECTASTICNDVSRIIVELLWEPFVTALRPTTAEEMAGLQRHMDFPFAFAAVDGCHLHLKCPAGGAAARQAYHNFKNFYSIVLMAMTDGLGRFIWAACGQPGNTHDSTYLQSTDIWDQLCYLCHLNTSVVDGVTIPSMVLGDGAFPFRTYLMKRFSVARPTEDQRRFNRMHSRSRVCIENAFGLLKARFRVLIRKCESHPENMRFLAMASVVLHNILISRNDMQDLPVYDENVLAGGVDENQRDDNAAAVRVRNLILPLVIR